MGVLEEMLVIISKRLGGGLKGKHSRSARRDSNLLLCRRPTDNANIANSLAWANVFSVGAATRLDRAMGHTCWNTPERGSVGNGKDGKQMFVFFKIGHTGM